MTKWEYATVEWYWNDEKKNIITYLPAKKRNEDTGTDHQLIKVLNNLGAQGWEVVTSCSSGNDYHPKGAWVYWTLKREVKNKLK
jgi:hypothetical protein